MDDDREMTLDDDTQGKKEPEAPKEADHELEEPTRAREVPPSAEELEEPTRGREVPSQPTLETWLLVAHRDQLRVVHLPEEGTVEVGRSPTAPVTIADKNVSRRHACFIHRDSGIWVEDCGSTNGTWVNGERVDSHKIEPGDTVAIGNGEITVNVAPRGAEPRDIESNDAFTAGLEREVGQARFFGRPLAVLMIQSQAHVGQWYPQLQAVLRPVDHVGAYSPGVLLLALPSAGEPEARELANRIVGLSSPAPLLCGVAVFPTLATSPEELVEVSRAAVRRATPTEPIQWPRGHMFSLPEGWEIVAASPPMQRVFATVDQVAPNDSAVLILGPNGSGKEVVGRAIHDRSPRREHNFVYFNCATTPAPILEGALYGHERGAFLGANRRKKGAFEEASGGTLFLDEIAEVSLETQSTLLRALDLQEVRRVGSSEDIRVDVRVIAATQRDLEEMCRRGQFRSDLYYHLNVFQVRVPPLLERPQDIEPLAKYFLRLSARHNQRPIEAISARALQALQCYSWPSNTRELRNVLERAVLLAETRIVTENDLPERVRSAGRLPVFEQVTNPLQTLSGLPAARSDSDQEPDHEPFKDRIRSYEAALITEALHMANGNQSQAARQLGIPLRTLVSKIRTYQIKITKR